MKKLIRKSGLVVLLASVVVPFFSAPQAKVHAAGSEAYNWKSVVTGAGGGFVPGIIFNQTQPNLIYARTDIGGAYRWNQTTGSWIPLNDSVGWTDWNKNGVDALATDPIDPNRVYMATGTYTNAWDDNGQIMRSTDQGATWQTTALPFKVGGNMPGRSMGERLMIDPNKNSILFYGARSGNGLWKSTDYGVTWAKVTSFTNTGTYIQFPGQEYGSDTVGLAWITFDKSTGSLGNATQTIYVGVADTGNSVFKSTDGGATWAAVPGQPTGYLPHHGVLSSTGKLYISYSNGVGPYDGSKGDVWKLDTATGTWTLISPVPGSSTDNYYGYGGLAVDAQNPNTVMVATLNSWWPDAIIFRSTDGGTTWSRIWDWNGYPNRTLRYSQDISAAPWLTFGKTAAPPIPSPLIGWMIGDLEIDPFNSNRMLYGTGATIYGSNNLTAWDTGGTVNIAVAAKGIEETAVLGLISPPSGTSHLISALGDISGFRHEDLTQAPTTYQTQPSYASTQSIDYAELNPSFMVRIGSADKSADANMKSIGLSSDGGSNWYMPSSEPSNGTTTTVGNGQVAVSANGNAIVWSTGDIGVYYSKTSGNSWTASTGVPAKAKVLSDRVNPNKFYAFYAGTFYISTDGGVTFTATAATGLPTNDVAGLQPNQAQLSIKAVPGIEGDIWFAGGNTVESKYGLWHSTNSGASFSKLTNVQEADLIGFGMAAPGQSYQALYTVAKIDGVRGVFRSDDTGATWVRINDDQHQYAKINMAITGDPRIYGRVYLGTNGRGILYADPVNVTSNSTISPTTATFDKKTANQADIAVTMTLNGNTLSSIKNGTATLVSGTDYTVSGSAVTIKKAYLAAQAVGTTTLTFTFSAGATQNLAVSIVDTSVVSSTISPTTAAFDKKTANQADIAVTMTLNGNTLSSIKNGTATLVSGTDYTVSGSAVTIKKEYLAAQAVGTTTLSFNFSAGSAANLAVTVVDTTGMTSSLKVQMYNGTTTSASNTLNPRFKLVNTGTSAVTLSNVKLRYYYTIDGVQAQSFWCDWSTIGSSNVTGSFISMTTPKTGADYYLEIGFTSGAGSLAAGQSIEIQTRSSKSDWTNYTQTGDYSFDSTDTSYVDWTKVPAYVSGSLAWGVEP
ncbi:X2-like carbohydrate binding domain-containing protein [Cohnella suwonensis]|uniref:X2-like carbohydrate binding domain-containing protein n=1 Tax=Cohnella suwonensis TaxID=696072 RepID=A0ABW0LSR4_9BACL